MTAGNTEQGRELDMDNGMARQCANIPREGVRLALDTSTAAMTMALVRDEQVLAQRDVHAERNHSTRIMPEVDALLAETGLGPQDLAGIVAGIGPGSYTGIRIGVTVAKTMAWALDIPLYGVSSLEALARGAVMRGLRGHAWIVPLQNARRGRVYTGLYASGPDGWRCLEQDGIRPLSEWLDQLRQRVDERDEAGTLALQQVLFTGDVAEFHPLLDDFASSLPEGIGAGTDDEPLSAAAVAILAREYGERCRVADPHALLPNYTQLSEPEQKLAARHAALKR